MYPFKSKLWNICCGAHHVLSSSTRTGKMMTLAHQMFALSGIFLNASLLQFKAKITSSDCLVVYPSIFMDHDLIQIK